LVLILYTEICMTTLRRAIKNAIIRFFLRRASPLVVTVARSLRDNKDAWKRDQFRVINTTAHVGLGVSSGVFGLKIEPLRIEDYELGFINLIYFERRLLWMCANEYKWHNPRPQQLIDRLWDGTTSRPSH
jgi:hypothetical protein